MCNVICAVPYLALPNSLHVQPCRGRVGAVMLVCFSSMRSHLVIPRVLPAQQYRACRMQVSTSDIVKKFGRVGFDWEEVEESKGQLPSFFALYINYSRVPKVSQDIILQSPKLAGIAISPATGRDVQRTTCWRSMQCRQICR